MFLSVPPINKQEDGAKGLVPGSIFWRRMPLVAAGGVGVLLLVSVIYIRSTVEHASQAVARGQGETLLQAGRLISRTGRGAPDSAILSQFLKRYEAEGLRHVALVTPRGEVLEQAGQALGASFKPGSNERVKGERVRLVRRLPPPGRGTAGQGRPRGWPTLTPPLLVIEYEPMAATELSTQATTLLLAALITVAVLLILALAVGRALRAREALLVQLERRRRLAELGTMSAVLAHELKNPLASLKGNAQLLVELLSEPGKPREKAEFVVREAMRLELLMGDLLQFVRSGDVSRVNVDPGELLREAAAEAAGDGVEVRVALGLECWSLDPEQMRRALVNVLRNAAQAQPQGIVAEVERRGGDLLFTVQDKGDGIAEGDGERIFDSFYTGRVKGVGLGLSITRNIVARHGGEVTAENSPEGGALFTLRIPPPAKGGIRWPGSWWPTTRRGCSS